MKNRKTPIEIDKENFKNIGHRLIDQIADFMDSIDQYPVTTSATAVELQKLIGTSSLPEMGTPPEELMSKASALLFNHSLFNGHPKFMGYITSSPAPMGVLADMLAATINPNVGAQILSPIATEIETQTVKWLAEFIGVGPGYGGLLVSGGNMANFTGFLAGRTAKAPKNIKVDGLFHAGARLLIYCSKTTHTWIEKAVNLFGFGTRSIRWIPADAANKMDLEILKQTIQNDIAEGDQPMMVIGTAGDVSTGAVDNLREIASICKQYNLWFHVDGAYGIPAAVVPEQKMLFQGIDEADSIALDPHKWLYSPLEAGCTLVKDPNHLIETYSSHPVYYNFSNNAAINTQNYYEYGFQNSRGFRALKVWLTLQQVGKTGYIKMITEDIELSKLMFDKARQHPDLEAITQNLSITTLRFVPQQHLPNTVNDETYLNTLNEALLNALQRGGEVFLSNAIVNGKYCLRGCIVNFRTSKKDIEEIIDIIVREGQQLHLQMREAFTGQNVIG